MQEPVAHEWPGCEGLQEDLPVAPCKAEWDDKSLGLILTWVYRRQRPTHHVYQQ